MIAPEPITLSDIDDYLEDLTPIAVKSVLSRTHGRFRRIAESRLFAASSSGITACPDLSNWRCQGIEDSFLPWLRLNGDGMPKTLRSLVWVRI
jgi:hypothetical protein